MGNSTTVDYLGDAYDELVTIDTFKAKHMVACFIIGANILPDRYGSFRNAVITLCKYRGWMKRW